MEGCSPVTLAPVYVRTYVIPCMLTGKAGLYPSIYTSQEQFLSSAIVYNTFTKTKVTM